MSLSKGFVWNHKGIRLVGYSMAGICTSIVFPDADVCFDVGNGLPFAIPVSNILLTHGHMDHASGLPYLIAMKAMTGQTPPCVYMPESLVRPLSQVMKIWQEIDQHNYQFQFRAIQAGEDRPLKAPYFVRPFPTFHRVASLGYTVFEKKKRLRDEFKDLGPFELGDLRKKGIELDEYYEEAIVSFTGDSKIECLDSPQVRNSRILLIEVTYWDKKKSVENAREWGHIHLDELIPRLGELKCEKIVLIHASARYNTPYLNEILDARIPEHIKHRVELFPRPI
jgi:ribonuclease Z